MREQLPLKTRQLLDENAAPGDALVSALVKDFNSLLTRDSLSQEKAFSAVTLPKAAMELSRKSPRTEAETRRLNRLLLERAYPVEIDNYLAVDLGRFNFNLHPVMIGVLAHLVLLSVGFLASLCFPPPPAEDRAMTLWGWLESRRVIREGRVDEVRTPHVVSYNELENSKNRTEICGGRETGSPHLAGVSYGKGRVG